MSDQPAEGSSPDSQPFERTVSETDLEGLKREQEEASRRYNDALTALECGGHHALCSPRLAGQSVFVLGA